MGKFGGALALVLLIFMAGAAFAAAPAYNSISIASSGGFTNDSTPTITINITGDCNNVGFACASGTTDTDWDWVGSGTSCPTAYDYNIIGGKNCNANNGSKIIYSIAKSELGGNPPEYSSPVVNATVTYDSAAPTIPSIAPENGSTTADENRTVAFVVDDATSGINLSSILVKLDDVTSAAFSAGSNCTPWGTKYTCTYTETSLLVKGSHTIKVNASDNAANAATQASSAFTYTDTTAPAQVGGFSASPGNLQVSLSWTASSAADINHYRVLRSQGSTGCSGKSFVANVYKPTTSYNDSGVNNETNYCYQITAVDHSGNENSGSCSEEKCATPTSGSSGSVTTPNIRADRSNDTWSNDDDIRFEWDITSNYSYCYRFNDSSNDPVSTGDPCISSNYKEYLDQPEGTTKYFHLRAKNGSGAYSNDTTHFTIKIDKTKPEQVTGLTVKLTDGEPELDWDAPNDSGGSGIGNYRIYRSTLSGFDPDDSDEYQFDETTSSTNYTDGSSLVNGRTYYYKVRAYDDAGNASEEASAQKSITAGESSSGSLTLRIEAQEYVTGDTLDVTVTSSGGRMWNAYLKVNINGEWKTLVSGKNDVSSMEGSMAIPEKYQGKNGYVYAMAEDDGGKFYDTQLDFVVDGKVPEANWGTAPAWDEANKKAVLSLKVEETGSGTDYVVFSYQQGSEWKQIAKVTSPKNGAYSYAWNTGTLTGRYVIKAEAVDKAGNSTSTEPVSLMFKATVQQETAEQPTTPTGEGTGTTEQPSDMTGLIFVGGGLLAGLVVLLAIVAVWLVVSQGREDMGMNSELLRASDRAERGSFVREFLRREPKKVPRKRSSGQGIFAYKG